MNGFNWVYNIIVIMLTLIGWFRYARRTVATIFVPRIVSYKPPRKTDLIVFLALAISPTIFLTIMILSIIYTFYPIVLSQDHFLVCFILALLSTYALMFSLSMTENFLLLFIGLKRKREGISRHGKVFSYWKKCPKCKKEYEVSDLHKTLMIEKERIIGFRCPFCGKEVYVC